MAATTTGRKRSNPVHQYVVIDESKTAYRCTDDDCEFTSLVKHGPTNLKLHLKKKHPEWQKQLEVKETAEKKAKTDSQSRKVTTMESFVNIAGSSSRSATTPLPASDYRQRRLNELDQSSLGTVLGQYSLETIQSWDSGLGIVVLGQWSWETSLGTVVLGQWSWDSGLGIVVLGQWSWDSGLGIVVLG